MHRLPQSLLVICMYACLYYNYVPEIGSEVGSEVCAETGSVVGSEIDTEVGDKVVFIIGDDVDSEVGSEIGSKVGVRGGSTVDSEVATKVLNFDTEGDFEDGINVGSVLDPEVEVEISVTVPDGIANIEDRACVEVWIFELGVGVIEAVFEICDTKVCFVAEMEVGTPVEVAIIAKVVISGTFIEVEITTEVMVSFSLLVVVEAFESTWLLIVLFRSIMLGLLVTLLVFNPWSVISGGVGWLVAGGNDLVQFGLFSVR